MYLAKDKIKMINLEITSRCNLLCLQCARSKHGQLNPLLPISDLPWNENVDELFTRDFCESLDCIYFSGNYGDFAAGKNADLFVDKFMERGLKRLGCYSNGSIRNSKWWFELGNKIRNRGVIIFSVDGLRDTNHIYRVNSNWDRIEANMRAAIDSGVEVNWDFLVFEHNYHQIEEAKEFANAIGVSRFNLKMTRRFLSWQDENQSKLSFANENIFQRSPKRELEMINEEFGSFENYVHKTEIHCKTKEDASSYMIDFEGRVWPCTWLGISRYLGTKDPQTKYIENLFEQFGEDFNSLKHKSFDEIIEGEFFQKYLEDSWKNSESRIYTCGRTCGKKFEYTSFPGYGNNLATNFNENTLGKV